MKKILNDPKHYVPELLQGLLAAHPGRLKAADGELHAIVRADAPVRGKVGIITGGGSGHLPVFLGYVGKGMLDGCAVGDVFASPSIDQMYKTTKAVSGGAGVLHLFGNYGGDVMNFAGAADLATMEDDIEIATVLVADDVASAPPERAKNRRGVAGMIFAFKIAGARADEMASLAEVKAAAEHALANTRSMGVALGPCIVPQVGKPTFTLGEDEMEIGMGIHGEQGVRRGKLQTADEIAQQLIDPILADMPLAGSEIALMVNSLGATPLEELYIMYNYLVGYLKSKDVRVYRPYIGRFATSMEMAGASLTVMKLDDELKRLLDAPASTPFFDQGQFV
ncbi:MAG TPA: dihydroxyacetone kinase subunit DhaK [Aggregatilineales bacterium]|nr:dihydroxyacetone kinase subunit DhaK [Aggregatilineales bacterium]